MSCYMVVTTNWEIVTKDLKEYDRSLEYYKIAAEYYKKTGSDGNADIILANNIGVNYHEKGEYKKSHFVFWTRSESR